MTPTTQTPTDTTPTGLRALNDIEIDALIGAALKTSAPSLTVPGAFPPGQPSPIANFDAVRRHRIQSSKTQHRQTLTVEECQRILGVRASVKMNYIPMMLSALARQEARTLADYGAQHKISDIKKHSRLIREMLFEYERALRRAYARAYDAYLEYLDRFRNLIDVNVWKMHLHADTLAANQHPGRPHRDIAVHALLCSMLIDYCEDYDNKVDRMLSHKLHRPVSRRPDSYLRALNDLCRSVLRCGHDLQPDDTLKTWIGVLSNQAWRLVDDIITEEDEQKEHLNQQPL